MGKVEENRIYCMYFKKKVIYHN